MRSTYPKLFIVLIIWWAIIFSLFLRSGNNSLTSSVLDSEPSISSPENTLPDVTEPPITKEDTPPCLLCIYDDTQWDPDLQKECEDAVKLAKKLKRQALLISQTEYVQRVLDGTMSSQLCGCHDIEVIFERHGSPWEENLTFDETKQIVEIYPTCSNIQINDIRCSWFDNVNDALGHAKKLQRDLAKMGYKWTISIYGAQTVNFMTADKYIDRRISFWKKTLFRSYALVSWRFDLALAKLPDIIKSEWNNCYAKNTPLGFKVCASDTKLLLYPCEKQWSESVLDRETNATRTIICEHQGKKANQTCVYKSNKKEWPGCVNEDGSIVDFSAKCPYFRCVWWQPELVTCSK